MFHLEGWLLNWCVCVCVCMQSATVSASYGSTLRLPTHVDPVAIGLEYLPDGF